MLSRNHLILGCPGGGKTHKLISLSIDALAGRSHPVIDLPFVTNAKDIAFLSFTKKAAQEGAERIKRETGNEGPNFRTIHSLCYNLLGLKRSNVVSGLQLHKVANEYNLDIGQDFGNVNSVRDLTYDEMLYQTCISVEHEKEEEQYLYIIKKLQQLNKPLYEGRLEKIKEMVSSFRSRDLYTFTDMLYQFLIGGHKVPKFDLLIVDEAQDLNILQWSVISKLRDQARTFIVAGDDSQAVHEWAGADVNYFLTLPDRYERMTKEVIEKSRRCPSRIQRAAVYINKRIKRKFDRAWDYKEEGGRIRYLRDIDLDRFDPFQSDKEIFMLARTNRDLNKFRKFGYSKGFIWTDGDNLSIDNREIKAVLNYMKLLEGESYNGEAIKEIFRYTTIKAEFDKDDIYDRSILSEMGVDLQPWESVFRIKEERARYVKKLLRRYSVSDLFNKPNITISTMHSVKGDEADIVLISEHLTSKIWKKWIDRADDELRVLYTAVTRSKDQVIFVRGEGKKQYNAEHFLSYA